MLLRFFLFLVIFLGGCKLNYINSKTADSNLPVQNKYGTKITELKQNLQKLKTLDSFQDSTGSNLPQLLASAALLDEQELFAFIESETFDDWVVLANPALVNKVLGKSSLSLTQEENETIAQDLPPEQVNSDLNRAGLIAVMVTTSFNLVGNVITFYKGAGAGGKIFSPWNIAFNGGNLLLTCSILTLGSYTLATNSQDKSSQDVLSVLLLTDSMFGYFVGINFIKESMELITYRIGKKNFDADSGKFVDDPRLKDLKELEGWRKAAGEKLFNFFSWSAEKIEAKKPVIVSAPDEDAFYKIESNKKLVEELKENRDKLKNEQKSKEKLELKKIIAEKSAELKKQYDYFLLDRLPPEEKENLVKKLESAQEALKTSSYLSWMKNKMRVIIAEKNIGNKIHADVLTTRRITASLFGFLTMTVFAVSTNGLVTGLSGLENKEKDKTLNLSQEKDIFAVISEQYFELFKLKYNGN